MSHPMNIFALITGILVLALVLRAVYGVGYMNGQEDVEMGPIHAGHYKKGFDDGRDSHVCRSIR